LILQVFVIVVSRVQFEASGIVTSFTKDSQSQYETVVGVRVDGNRVGVGEAVTVGEGDGISVGGTVWVSIGSKVEDDCVSIASTVYADGV